MAFRRLRVGSGAIAVVGVLVSNANATVLDLSTTTAANWVVTGGGAVNAPAFQHTQGRVTLTSNGTLGGTFATGGSYDNFNGYWYTDAKFTLPANAQNVYLDFSNLIGDDRVVLELNGTIIGDYFLIQSNKATGDGVFSFLPGPTDVPYTFQGMTTNIINTGFILGGVNDLRMIVNNTAAGTNMFKPTITFSGSGQFTHAGIQAYINYTQPVPEPASLGVLALGVAGLLIRRRRLA